MHGKARRPAVPAGQAQRELLAALLVPAPGERADAATALDLAPRLFERYAQDRRPAQVAEAADWLASLR